MSNITNKVSSVLGDLENFLKTKTVVGEAITIDDVTIIPLVDISFGVGFGAADKDKKGGEKTGGGCGANITPNSVLVIKKGEAKVISIKNSNSITELIPKVVKEFNKMKSKTK